MRVVTHLHAVFLRGRILGLNQPASAAGCFDYGTAEELELAFVLERVTAETRHEANAAAVEPLHGLGAAADDRLREIRITVPLSYAAEIVQILFSGVLAEVRVLDFARREIRHHAAYRFHSAMNHAEPAAGVSRVAATLFFRRAFEHEHVRAVLTRGERSA